MQRVKFQKKDAEPSKGAKDLPTCVVCRGSVSGTQWVSVMTPAKGIGTNLEHFTDSGALHIDCMGGA